ncbi:MAG TPA: class I SAM-dependent methyltransferase [Jatrophihabitans sp.]|jgi:SAM-dependent methyltransferase|uniref:class I SAM-dependent DNA methyltransferase n=1 Tax=Jatrophihabitans sp. TaxID=1932789 RepID=UPI002E0957CC|nr:class I SAM-dependent methyltransferase [Jatrophihabitans sp.]
MSEPGDVTIASYDATVDLYVAQTATPSPVVAAWLDHVADVIGPGHVLEVGSGPGHDALRLEEHGLRVSRTDATPGFVDRLRAAGHDARRLDLRSDDLGGPYDAMLADAVLLHLDRTQFADVLARARRAVVDGGVLAFTIKEGDGDEWHERKLGVPRHFTYWREPAVRAALENTGWQVVELEHVSGFEPWLYVIARTA